MQGAVLWSRATLYKPIAPVDQSDLEYVISGDSQTYVDPNIHMMIRGNLVHPDESNFDSDDHTSVVNNLLLSLLSKCSITLNGVSISASKDLYNYRVYLERLLTYGQDASRSHLTNAFCYLDVGDFLAKDPPSDSSKRGYHARWKLTRQSSEIELYRRIHGDLFNVAQLLLPGVQLQIKFTKAKSDFYVLSTKSDAKAVFKFLDTPPVREARETVALHPPRSR